MMSTPDATSVDSVREKRAIVTFKTTSPIFIGSASLKRSHFLRPLSDFFQRKKPKIEPMTAGKMMYHLLCSSVRHPDDDLRELRKVAAELLEDLHEDRNEEQQHPVRTRVAKTKTIVG